MKRARKWAPLLLLCLCGLATGAWGQDVAAKVTVRQVDSLGNTLAEEAYVSTEEAFTSVSAPARTGYRFMHWTTEWEWDGAMTPAQPDFTNRDAWGRALDAVSVVPKDKIVTLTAVYGDATADADNNGMPDAEEDYWYGRAVGANEDTDDDGFTFAQELQYGMNPLFPNTLALGGVAWGDGPTLLYNPNGYATYIVRSEPEGRLFATYAGSAAPGTVVTTSAYSPSNSVFAYWTVNGARQHDAWGVSLNAASWTVQDSTPLEFVAHCVEEEQPRQAHYWYGKATDPTSDSDGDGITFEEELRYGMNPVFPNTLVLGGVAWGDGPTLLYNPNEYPEITLRSEPEGVFPTESFVLRPGDERVTAAYTPADRFSGWSKNAVRQADAWGRALDSLTLVGAAGVGKVEVVATFDDNEHRRVSQYWYGVDDQPDNDTDGDGFTFAQELQYGMNPRFPNTLGLGGVAWGDGPVRETNLQLFDQASKALMGGNLADFFATTDGATGDLTGGQDFGGAVAPAVLPREDGRFDFLTYAKKGTLTRYRNNGTVGSPDFEAAVGSEALAQALGGLARPVLCGGAGDLVWFCDDGGVITACNLATGETAKTVLTGFPVWETTLGFGAFKDGTLTLALGGTFTCNVAPEAVTSAALAEATGDGLADLLVADALGRISLYERVGDGFELRHRVWGGSFEGFAQGLTLAPIDWDGDGDLDMLCGTAEGKLLLLSDPKVGKPSNLRAAAGIDNVLLAWDPNGQSRVCGYNVYRAAATDFAHLGETPLPSYRDQNLSPAEWAYRVTALSRRWVAGNSEPKVFESDPSDIVKATVGNVTLSLPESVTVYEGQQVVVPLSVNNAQGVTGAMSFTFTYDAAALAPVSFAPSALAQKLTFESAAANGTWTLTTNGTLEAGAGELLRLRFRALASGTSAVTLTGATLGSITATLEGNITTVTVQAPPKPPRLTLKAEDVEAPLGTDEVDVPLTLAHVSTSGAMDWDTLTVSADFDPAQLALVFAPDIHGAGIHDYRFKVLTRTNEAQVAEVTFSAAAKDTNGLAAEVSPTTARVVIAPKASTSGTPSLILLKVVGAEGNGLIRDDGDDDDDEFDVKIDGEVTVKVRATAKGTEAFDWERFSLSAAWKPQGGLAQQGDPVLERTEGATAYYAVTFKVLEPVYKGDRHDDDDDDWDDRWEDDIDIVFTGAVADAPDIKVRKAECEFEIEGRLDPRRVPPWHAGDLDGDGYLTGNDYQIARNHMKAYHQTGNAKKDKPHDTDDAHKVHASLLMVPGITDPLTLKDVTVTYKKYLSDVCGVPPGELNMGNNGGKK